MKKSIIFLGFLTLFSNSIFAQKDTIKLKEIKVLSNRISLPFSKTSQTIKLISKEEINNAAATNLADLLQQVVGIDIRRRGVDGMQSDLYIRGGNFDQTLILIDGVKMDDVQTGHHNMNAILPLEDIESIEIIKGPAARVYGQNAFTGAINIITKRIRNNSLNLGVNYGSYQNKKGLAAISQKFEKGDVYASVSFQKSDGYRYNTDFQNVNSFLKTSINNYQLISTFAQRKFGANGFYASPEFTDQYEETQTNLVAVSSNYKTSIMQIKPRIYWRRNQDMYLFIRNNPSYYRNLHISNKLGAETNVVINSKLGKTGIGFDLSRTFLISNNLGNHNRTVLTGFFEHRFEFKNKFDVTPGIAVSYYSDFKTNAFPGLAIGYRISDKVKVYGNIGYTYRVPTFTDMFYVGPTTQGNPNLKPESALSEEVGFKYNSNKFHFTLALFNRNSDNLIDWTKANETDKWETKNFSKVITQGIETTVNYQFKINNYNQILQLGYNYINDNIKDVHVQFTRYSLNSIKHQFNTNIQTEFFKNIHQNLSFRYVERTDGTSYNVVDAKVSTKLKKTELSLNANNIFNAVYTETNLIPMPKGNLMIGLKYTIY
jgi:iron complex outermembrane receptor protein